MVMQGMNLIFNHKQLCCYQPLDRNGEHTFVYVTRVPNDHTLIKSEYFEILSENERKKALAFRFIEDRNSYITAHALLRAALSLHFHILPNEWVFRNSQLGKPEQINLPNKAHFNLSRTRGMVCCAISSSPVGIDIESFDALNNYKDFISLLNEKEANTIRFLSDSEKRLYTVIFWTLKESFLKSTGEGIGGLPNGFWFRIEKIDKRIKLQSNIAQNHNLRRWRFATFLIDHSYVFSISIYTKNNKPLVLIDSPTTELFGASKGIEVNIKNYVCK